MVTEAVTVATHPVKDGRAEGMVVTGVEDGFTLGTNVGAEVRKETQKSHIVIIKNNFES